MELFFSTSSMVTVLQYNFQKRQYMVNATYKMYDCGPDENPLIK